MLYPLYNKSTGETIDFSTKEERDQYVADRDLSIYQGQLPELIVRTPEAKAANRQRVENSYYGSNSPAGHYRFLDRRAMSNPANPYDAARGLIGFNAGAAVGAFNPVTTLLSLGGYYGGNKLGNQIAPVVFDRPDRPIKINEDTYTTPREIMSEGAGFLGGAILTGKPGMYQRGLQRSANRRFVASGNATKSTNPNKDWSRKNPTSGPHSNTRTTYPNGEPVYDHYTGKPVEDPYVKTQEGPVKGNSTNQTNTTVGKANPTKDAASSKIRGSQPAKVSSTRDDAESQTSFGSNMPWFNNSYRAVAGADLLRHSIPISYDPSYALALQKSYYQHLAYKPTINTSSSGPMWGVSKYK